MHLGCKVFMARTAFEYLRITYPKRSLMSALADTLEVISLNSNCTCEVYAQCWWWGRLQPLCQHIKALSPMVVGQLKNLNLHLLLNICMTLGNHLVWDTCERSKIHSSKRSEENPLTLSNIRKSSFKRADLYSFNIISSILYEIEETE